MGAECDDWRVGVAVGACSKAIGAGVPVLAFNTAPTAAATQPGHAAGDPRISHPALRKVLPRV